MWRDGTALISKRKNWQPLYAGVIELPVSGGSNNAKSMVILREFPYNNALFGLVI